MAGVCRDCGLTSRAKGFRCSDCYTQAKEDRALNKVGPDLREWVLKRDGHKCLACHATENLQVDHVIPHSAGGKTDPDNLQTLCKSCNSDKRTSNPYQNFISMVQEGPLVEISPFILKFVNGNFISAAILTRMILRHGVELLSDFWSVKDTMEWLECSCQDLVDALTSVPSPYGCKVIFSDEDVESGYFAVHLNMRWVSEGQIDNYGAWDSISTPWTWELSNSRSFVDGEPF